MASQNAAHKVPSPKVGKGKGSVAAAESQGGPSADVEGGCRKPGAPLDSGALERRLCGLKTCRRGCFEDLSLPVRS